MERFARRFDRRCLFLLGGGESGVGEARRWRKKGKRAKLDVGDVLTQQAQPTPSVTDHPADTAARGPSLFSVGSVRALPRR